jgi:hypothetical protein
MGDFFGLPTGVLENDSLRLEYLTTAGPRIVRLSRKGKANLFAELPNFQIGTPHGPFLFYGGHRFWAAPERMPDTYEPDNMAVEIQTYTDGVKLTQTGGKIHVFKSMEILLSQKAPKVTIKHKLQNDGDKPILIAPWALTMCRLGGIAILPQPVGNADADGFLPNRFLELWPYARINDPRLILRDDFILIRGVPESQAIKIGYFNPHGWMAYWLEGTLFKKTFSFQLGEIYPDGGCNAESYCKDQFIELETLGPLSQIKPGQSVEHTETWELFDGLEQPFLSESVKSELG